MISDKTPDYMARVIKDGTLKRATHTCVWRQCLTLVTIVRTRLVKTPQQCEAHYADGRGTWQRCSNDATRWTSHDGDTIAYCKRCLGGVRRDPTIMKLDRVYHDRAHPIPVERDCVKRKAQREASLGYAELPDDLKCGCCGYFHDCGLPDRCLDVYCRHPTYFLGEQLWQR